MEFKLNIDMDNAVFDSMPEFEISSMLLEVATRYQGGEVDGQITDINGNTVGSFETTFE
jgi:hypothetical protein